MLVAFEQSQSTYLIVEEMKGQVRVNEPLDIMEGVPSHHHDGVLGHDIPLKAKSTSIIQMIGAGIFTSPSRLVEGAFLL